LDQAKFQMKAVATKRIIFLVQNLNFGTKSEKDRPRFHSVGPETFAMVDGRGGRSLAPVWIDGARCRPARYVDPGRRCTGHSQAPWRHAATTHAAGRVRRV
jgi:hypothetical protein